MDVWRLIHVKNIENFNRRIVTTCQKKALPCQMRNHASLINFKDDFFFLSGGSTEDNIISDSVEKYNISANKWTNGPKLNQERYRHSGCSLNEYIYVFCGTNQEFMRINSIESLAA